MTLSDLILISENSYSAVGGLKVHSCSFESSNNQVFEKFGGIVILEDGDSLFISVNIDNYALVGELIIGNGSGKYESSRGY